LFLFSGAIGGFGLRGFCLLGHSGCLGEKGSFFFILGLLGCGVVIIMGLDSVFFSCFHLSFARRARNSRLGLVCLGLLPLMNGTFRLSDGSAII
jgi:hypothetical protein